MNLSSAMKRQTVLIAASGIARSDDLAISFAGSFHIDLASRYLPFDYRPDDDKRTSLTPLSPRVAIYSSDEEKH